MSSQSGFARFLGLLAMAVLLTACGGDHATPDATTATPGLRKIEGAIVKGPLVGATVAFFNIDEAGQPTGVPIVTATTDAFGHVTTGLPAGDEPLLAVSSGGSYVDESDDAGGENRRRITLDASEGFAAIVPADADTFVMTPYSMALLLRARRLANGANFLVVYEALREQATSVLGFDPTSVIPDDPLAPNLQGDPAAVQYALLLGGAAYAINAIAVDQGVLPTYEIVLAFILDLSDGIVDGRLADASIDVKAVIDDVDLNAQILRFRNNHFELYDGVLITVDEAAWSDDPPLPPNLPPFARVDLIEVDEGESASTLNSGASSLLANDSDTGGAALTAALVEGPAHGSLELDPDGGFSYQHDGSETTSDLFFYKVNNGSLDSAPAPVLITIEPVNDAPVGIEDAYATDGELEVDAPGVLANDTDAEGSDLAAQLVRKPLKGGISLATDGSFVYTPSAGFKGTDSFTYRASDGEALSVETLVTIRVGGDNGAPVARDDRFERLQGETLLVVRAPGVLGNDVDEDGDSLSAILVTPPEVGSVALNPNGSFRYNVPAGFNGPASFEYRVTDGQATSDVATVLIAVGVNGSPIARPDQYFYDDPLIVPDEDGVIARNDEDPEGDELVAELVSGPENASFFSLNPGGGFTYVPNNNQNAKFFITYDQFSYRVTDGFSYSQTVTVSIGFNACDCSVDF
jgi:VCBS repeat-containing protein